MYNVSDPREEVETAGQRAFKKEGYACFNAESFEDTLIHDYTSNALYMFHYRK